MTSKQLKSLGKIIKLLGTKDLELKLYKHRQPVEELNMRMAKVPERFHVRSGGDSDICWKSGRAEKLYGLDSIEISMFYKRGEGGENIEDKSTV